MFDKAPSVNFELGELANVTSGDSLTSEYILDEIDAINRYVVYGANGIRGYYKEANRHSESVLIGRVGAQAGNVHYCNGSFFATEHALVIEIHNHEVDCKWLSYDLKNKNLVSIAKGVAQPVISSSSLKKEVIKVPSFELQKKFVEFTRLIDKSKYIAFIHSPDGIVKFILLRNFNKNGIILLYLEEVFMLNMIML